MSGGAFLIFVAAKFEPNVYKSGRDYKKVRLRLQTSLRFAAPEPEAFDYG
jgi:hypothetical protein